MSKSELGSSYSFWLPWDEVGGPRTEVSLICRFEPKGGAVVSSEQAKQSLPGREPVLAGDGTKHPPKLPDGVPSKPAIQTLQSLQAQRRETHDARQASYEVPVANDPQALAIEAAQNNSLLPAKRMTATTINLPNNFQMPSAAAIRDRNVPAVNHAPLTAASYSQPLLSQSALQQTPNVPPMLTSTQTPVTRQLGQNIAGAGGRPNLSPINLPSQIPQAPASALNTMTPTMKPSIQSPGGISTTPISMSPQQPPANQAALQQMLQQQQALQQKIIQLEAQSPTGMPRQVGNTATVSYPTGGQYQR